MRIKSYFADSFQTAMETARKEMGADAVLVSSRPAPAESRSLGAYEVVCATDLPATGATQSAGKSAVASSLPGNVGITENPSPERRPGVALSGNSPNGVAIRTTGPVPEHAAKSAVDAILAEVQDMRRQFRSWQQSTWQMSDRPHWIAASPALKELYGELIHTEIDPDLAQQLLAAAMTNCGDSAAELLTAFAQQIQDAVQMDSALGASCVGSPSSGTFPPGSRVVALVGPPGAGKTSTIAKLAVRYGLPSRQPTVLLSFDALRVAASEQLRTYATLLGLRFEVVETTLALDQAIEQYRGKGLILIDTPGFSLRDLDGGCESASFLANRPDIQKHLVLPASMRRADMTRISSAYDIFRPSHLIFTRMDETETFGPVLNEAMGSGRPLSFFGTGQQVPEDLEAASHNNLLSRLLRFQSPVRSVAAAA